MVQRRGKWIVLGCLRAIVNVVYCVVPYLYIFNDVAILPGIDQNGQHITGRFTYSRSALDRLETLGCSWLLYVHIALACVSAVSGILACIWWRKKNLQKSSWIAFGISTAVFVCTLLIASKQYALY